MSEYKKQLGYLKKRTLEYQIVVQYTPDTPEVVQDKPLTKATVVQKFQLERRRLSLWARVQRRPMPKVRLRKVDHGAAIRSAIGQDNEGEAGAI